jgi:GxxExxY protein
MAVHRIARHGLTRISLIHTNGGATLQERIFSARRRLHGDSSGVGKGTRRNIYKDALVIELSRAGIPFLREKNYEITYKGVILPHYYYADFVVWDKILFEAKAVEKLTDSHIKQVLNYLAASRLRVGLLVNFGSDSLEWKRVVL